MIQETQIWKEMISGRPYDALDPILLTELSHVRDLVQDYNSLRATDIEMKRETLSRLLGAIGEEVSILQPFRCDYGKNIFIGSHVVVNFNLTVLDEAHVTIGDNVFIGPNCSIYTACHPTDPIERNKGIEWSLPVTIGSNVWLGGNVTILPGVTIGDNTTIGAGSVVTTDIPAGVVAVGNPCRPVKKV